MVRVLVSNNRYRFVKVPEAQAGWNPKHVPGKPSEKTAASRGRASPNPEISQQRSEAGGQRKH
jgi:hypothetical protein